MIAKRVSSINGCGHTPNTITIMAQTKVINVAIFCDVVVTAGALSLSGLRKKTIAAARR